MRIIIVISFIMASFSLQAQEVMYKDVTYVVKKGTILKEGKDITETLSLADKEAILKLHENKMLALKEKVEAEKLQRKKEKDLKKAEKAQKKAEKQLKRNQKLQKDLDKARGNHAKAKKKYERLKGKGKLSPVDEQRWIERLEKLNERVSKAERKLKKA